MTIKELDYIAAKCRHFEMLGDLPVWDFDFNNDEVQALVYVRQPINIPMEPVETFAERLREAVVSIQNLVRSPAITTDANKHLSMN